MRLHVNVMNSGEWFVFMAHTLHLATGFSGQHHQIGVSSGCHVGVRSPSIEGQQDGGQQQDRQRWCAENPQRRCNSESDETAGPEGNASGEVSHDEIPLFVQDEERGVFTRMKAQKGQPWDPSRQLIPKLGALNHGACTTGKAADPA